MLKAVVIALVTLGLVVVTNLALAPAKATTSNSEVYFWGYTSPGNSQVVCKKVVTHPNQKLQSNSSNQQSVQMYSESSVVSDSYCAALAKPSSWKG